MRYAPYDTNNDTVQILVWTCLSTKSNIASGRRSVGSEAVPKACDSVPSSLAPHEDECESFPPSTPNSNLCWLAQSVLNREAEPTCGAILHHMDIASCSVIRGPSE
jgi:hypothetical protein